MEEIVEQIELPVLPSTEIEALLTELLDIDSGALKGFALKLTRNEADAEDLMQETAATARDKKSTFRSGTNFKARICTIMRNLFINEYRKKQRKKTVMDGTNNTYYLDNGAKEVLNEGEMNMSLESLLAFIDTLDDTVRMPFMMVYQGYQYQEIADQLDLPLGTVKSRIFAARKQLKEKLKKVA